MHEFSESDWDTMLDTNLKAVFLLSKAVVPEMIARGSGEHHQYQFAGREKHVPEWQRVLRVEMGIDGADRLHGGRLARARDSRGGGVPGFGGDGVFNA